MRSEKDINSVYGLSVYDKEIVEAYNRGFNDALTRVEQLLRVSNTRTEKAGARRQSHEDSTGEQQ